jgi:branched-chain amino acid aminotransferase
MAMVWLNGDLLEEKEARLFVTDRGFTLADGIFETMRAVKMMPYWFTEHFERLTAGAAELGFSVPFSEHVFGDAIHQLLLESAAPAESAIRLTVTRGPAAARGLWPTENSSRPTCLLTVARAIPPHPQDFVICKSTRRNEYSPLARIKSLSYGDNILARREAIGRGVGDAIMLNTKGNIACATVGNVFFRVAGRWMTPSSADGILPGLARRRLLKEVDAVEAPLSIEAIMRADAGFVSNSLGCTQIKSIDGHALSGDLTDLPISSVYSP